MGVDDLRAVLRRLQRPSFADELAAGGDFGEAGPGLLLEIDSTLRNRPDLFVFTGDGWVLRASRWSPEQLLLALDRRGPCSVSSLASHLRWEPSAVRSWLLRLERVVSSEQGNPPLWRLTAPVPRAMGVMNEFLIEAAASDTRLSRWTTDEGPDLTMSFEHSSTGRILRSVRETLEALAAAGEDRSAKDLERIRAAFRALQAAEKARLAGAARDVQREVDRLTHDLRQPLVERAAPNREYPRPRIPGSYGKRRCGHTGRCSC